MPYKVQSGQKDGLTADGLLPLVLLTFSAPWPEGLGSAGSRSDRIIMMYLSGVLLTAEIVLRFVHFILLVLFLIGDVPLWPAVGKPAVIVLDMMQMPCIAIANKMTRC
jgi:hypothetical protein